MEQRPSSSGRTFCGATINVSVESGAQITGAMHDQQPKPSIQQRILKWENDAIIISPTMKVQDQWCAFSPLHDVRDMTAFDGPNLGRGQVVVQHTIRLQ